MVSLEQYKNELLLILDKYIDEYRNYLIDVKLNDYNSIQSLSEHLQNKIDIYKGNVTSNISQTYPYNGHTLNEKIRFYLYTCLSTKYSEFDSLTEHFWADSEK
ncbi:hypothetical protein [Gelidibacter japonicus]|uniref:hypothetical protein n=1 Tax=Gelidibacter japonicus TaxID=1962232 RepID=UPI003A927CF1